MRRLVSLLAAVLLLGALSACGIDWPGSPARSPDDGPAADPASEEPTTEDPEPSPEPETEIVRMWVDDDWAIEEADTDICEMIGPSPTPYSDQEDVFMCGPNAASALACVLEEGDRVVCITNPTDRRAVAFDSPAASAEVPSIDDAARSTGDASTMPLVVALEDGAMCTIISHDHDEHWGGLRSWYRCNDDSELLTEDGTQAADTFDRGPLWTAQRSVDKQEPEQVEVEVATFAGR